jgi:cyclic pyranopterin phosphate synthase
MLVDAQGRTIDYLRVSVTDRCNLRCWYCMPPEGVAAIRHDDVLRYEEILAVLEVAVPAGVSRVRLTGGEPLVRRGVVDMVRAVAALPGIGDVGVTTNGLLLPRLAAPLREAGLTRVNLGLPSLDPERYREITRCGELADALAGLDAAVAAGFSPIKLNVVALRDVNDAPGPWLELIGRAPVEVRFIEYMPIGPRPAAGVFVSAEELRRRFLDVAGGRVTLDEVRATPGGGPARIALRPRGAPGAIAMIPAMTEHFCDRCNRLRLTADGHLRTCLLGRHEVDLKPALRPRRDPEAIERLLRRAVAEKPACMPGAASASAFDRQMSQIGG